MVTGIHGRIKTAIRLQGSNVEISVWGSHSNVIVNSNKTVDELK